MVCIGDIHGTYKTLKLLLKEFPSDPICLVGDLIDRGPDSVDVIQFVMDNYDRIKCVQGNHEKMMTGFYHGGGRARFGDVWLMNGGKKVWQAYEYKYGQQKRIDHVNFLKSLPDFIEFKDIKNKDGRYLMVSHSVATSLDLEGEAASGKLCWGRHFPTEDPYEGTMFNVFGHTPVYNPIINDWSANIDTGACFGEKLTALVFPEMRIVQVQSLSKCG